MKPILFNGEMVRAILDGMKSVTRRVVKGVPDIQDLQPYTIPVCKEPQGLIAPNGRVYNFESPYKVGDILYVRETWAELETVNGTPYYAYKADDLILHHSAGENFTKWRPSIHMPKVAARCFIRVTNVSIKKLQDVTAQDIRDEGLTSMDFHVGDMEIALSEFSILWNSTIKSKDINRYGWNANPWVWVIEFEKIESEDCVCHKEGNIIFM